jgi:hypothetical protein
MGALVLRDQPNDIVIDQGWKQEMAKSFAFVLPHASDLLRATKKGALRPAVCVR